MDQSSSISDQLNPLDYRLTYAPSAFDVKHNFVVSYNFLLPFEQLFHVKNRLTKVGNFLESLA